MKHNSSVISKKRYYLSFVRYIKLYWNSQLTSYWTILITQDESMPFIQLKCDWKVIERCPNGTASAIQSPFQAIQLTFNWLNDRASSCVKFGSFVASWTNYSKNLSAQNVMYMQNITPELVWVNAFRISTVACITPIIPGYFFTYLFFLDMSSIILLVN